MWQNGLETLTFTTGEGCPALLSCFTLVQVWTNNGTLRQDTLVTDGSESLFFPAVSADERGDLTSRRRLTLRAPAIRGRSCSVNRGTSLGRPSDRVSPPS